MNDFVCIYEKCRLFGPHNLKTTIPHTRIHWRTNVKIPPFFIFLTFFTSTFAIFTPDY